MSFVFIQAFFHFIYNLIVTIIEILNNGYITVILKEISPEYSLEGLMLKLKLQYFGHVMGKTDSFEKTLRLGKIEGRRRRGQQRMVGWQH